MTNQTNIFQIIKSVILTVTIFFFPLFFLPTTQEYFYTNKLYLLSLAAMLLLLTSFLEIITNKKLAFYKSPNNILTFVFILSIIASILLVSTNKIQAVLNPNFGLLAILSLSLISFYLQNSSLKLSKVLSISSLLLSIITIFFYFQNSLFSPIGTRLDLAAFLGFCLIFQLVQTGKKSFFYQITFALTTTAFALALLSAISELANFPPLRYSWHATLQVFKYSLNAIFGSGLDNYLTLFAKVKDVAYNQSKFWQIDSFNVSRSAFLHVLTESGLFGLISFLLLFILSVKQLPLLVYLATVFLFLPPSLPLFFIFFIGAQKQTNPEGYISIDLKQRPFFYFILVSIILVITSCSYLLGRSYLAEYYFKKSLDALAEKNIKETYNNQRSAIIANPYIERFRISFSQTNLLIANNIAAKARTSNKTPEKVLSAQDRQTINQAIKTSIEEAKAVIGLNEQKATNWENLGVIYRNLINTARGADTWAISSYHRAIVLDPQNPKYRLELGGIYYLVKNYDESSRYFEQATVLKPDWPNAHYNLAWALFQKKEYQKAVSEMQTVISLLDSKKNSADLEKAKKDLEEFKLKLNE